MAANLATRSALAASILTGATFGASPAYADIVLAEGDGWEVYTNGRVAAFFSYAHGEGAPIGQEPGKTYRVEENHTGTGDIRTEQKEYCTGFVDEDGVPINFSDGDDFTDDDAQTRTYIDAAGMEATGPLLDPYGVGCLGNAVDPHDRGKIRMLRLRSGFTGNVLGFGVRRDLTESTTLTAYTSLTSTIETTEGRKYPVAPDVREGYFKVDAPWGHVAVGRLLSLYSRGATEITYLYGYKYGLGFPGGGQAIQSGSEPGTTAGHIGFGVAANYFSPGVIYATPDLVGLQLNVGVFDAVSLGGNWERVKWPRPEAELTFDAEFTESMRLHLFGNGLWQTLYMNESELSTTIWGAGAGGRFEIDPIRIGFAGHRGRGIGFYYALDASPAVIGPQISDQPFRGNYPHLEPRIGQGYYVQVMAELGKIDLFAGHGVSMIKLLDIDKIDTRNDDVGTDPTALVTPSTDDWNAETRVAEPDGVPDSPRTNVGTEQVGFSGGVVFHLTDYLHLDLDYFNALFKWHLGDTQQVHFVNLGATVDW